MLDFDQFVNEIKSAGRFERPGEEHAPKKLFVKNVRGVTGLALNESRDFVEYLVKSGYRN